MNWVREKSHYLIYAAPFVWLVAITAVFHWTSPLQLGPAGILLVFAIFYAFISSLFLACTHGAFLIVAKVTGKKITMRRAYYLSSVLALGPLFFIALNTLGQLGIVEVILVVALLGTASFYVVRRT